MKRVLIVRLDAIGDWILFRNVLSHIRRSAKYRDAELTVFGNPAWKGVAELLDGDSADHWIWCDNRNDLFRKGYENLLPRCVWHRRILRAQREWRDRLAALAFDEVLVPQAFEDPLLDEFVEGLAPKVIRGWELPQGDDEFVFLRNRMMASAMTGNACDVPLEMSLGGIPDRCEGVLFFPGASHWTRRWPMRKWRALERDLREKGIASRIAATTGSFRDFFRQVASSRAVVSNDTMAAHAAAALGVPVVVITNGLSGKGGFWPYPSSLGKKVEVLARGSGRRHSLLVSQFVQYQNLVSVGVGDVVRALARCLGGEDTCK